MNFEKAVVEWFANLEKGYAIPPYTKEEIRVLERIVKSQATVLNENAEWDKLIADKFPNGVPDPVGTYKIPQGKTGPISIAPGDKKVYETLFKVKPGAGVGNGELALYWLFSKSTTVESTGKGAAADLRIGGLNCEVKSYKKHDGKIKLGKFKELRNSRQIISRVFGILNLTKAFDRNSDSSFFTETKFTVEDLRQGFESLLDLNAKQMKAEIDWVLKTFEGKDNDQDLAKACMAKVVSEKLDLKPGFGGYMINCLKEKPTDIKSFYIPTNAEAILRDTDFDTLNKNTAVNSGEIELNYNELFG